VSGDGARATEIIDHERRADAGRLVGVHENGRQAARQRVLEASAADVRRHHQQTVDAPVHRSQRIGCLGVFPCVLETSRCRPRERAARSTPRDELRRNTPVNIRQQQPLVWRATDDQAARGGMWRVISRLAARSTRSRTFGVPKLELLRVRDTEAIETRARRATSLIVAATHSPQQPRCSPSGAK